ncbi:calcium/calmodulin dependent protein kinase [Lentithecium fluviatile CBS 122367]|uniref:Calcium/calmodulin dependent protein kinase n=1 Tax=Lentithecium fluviatile CBS 122367 TaxID=1168545 RepID=A0A6G1JPH0_9PLEO|nr:calcium/calmodulin dependent protein kinase [Lentithecium fluviatile CBS 122367]
MTAITRAVGQSGRRYVVERLLQEKPGPLGRVYLVSFGSQQNVLKSVPQNDFKSFQDMFSDLQGSSNIRVADDAIPDQSMFAYRYFRGHLLSFAQTNPPLLITKQILRDSLRGIAALHEKGIVHSDIKANNIMLEFTNDETDGNVTVSRVQIAEDAAYVPDDSAIVARRVGNWTWRSPEAHASRKVQKPSDIFSFGIVCIYALTKRVIFAVEKEELEDGCVEELAIVLERQLSYFADLESLDGLLQYLGDSPLVQLFTIIANGFDEEHPRAPIALWKDIDPDFKDLIGKMTNIGPKRRITAHEALAHRWFADVTYQGL